MENPESHPLMMKLRKLCLGRVWGIENVARSFHVYDNEGNRKLHLEEFKTSLAEYSFGISEDEMGDLFAEFDTDSSGTIDSEAFLRALSPPITDSRMGLVKKAFKKLDQKSNGFIPLQDLKDNYKVLEHRKYKRGWLSEEEVLKEFVDCFQANGDENAEEKNDYKVTWEDFLNYYSGVSACIFDDVDFKVTLCNSWDMKAQPSQY